MVKRFANAVPQVDVSMSPCVQENVSTATKLMQKAVTYVNAVNLSTAVIKSVHMVSRLNPVVQYVAAKVCFFHHL